MAVAYVDLIAATEHGPLYAKVRVAIAVAAETIRAEATPTAAELAWAKLAANPSDEMVRAILFAVVVANRSAANVDAIKNAVDASVQGAVDDIVPSLTT